MKNGQYRRLNRKYGSNYTKEQMIIKKYFILALIGLIMAGCSSDDNMDDSVQERLPLSFVTSLSDSRLVTRAVDYQIEPVDELLCYVRHIIDGSPITEVQAKQVTIINDAPTEALYWDDFSESTADGSKDLRSENHGLQSFYGYCYNGGSATTDLDEAAGALEWTTASDQSIEGAMKKNDLLWSKTQEMVTYKHAKNNHGTLSVPYTHAMSKFTIVLVLGEGFEAKDFENVAVTLSDMNLKGEFTAPASQVVPTGATDVKMFANAVSTVDGKTSRAYEAVVVPKTSLTEGKLYATIQNVDGNDYEVVLTHDILTNWAKGIDNNASKSGINYKLTVILNKQNIRVVATLSDWTDVSATGNGEINFKADVTAIDKDNHASLKDGDSFSLFWKNASSTSDFKEATTTTLTDGKWTNSPAIYWPNGNDSYEFRALAKKTSDKTLDAITSNSVVQGTDLLWGITAAHTGTEADGTTVHDYAEGAAINPRTGDVPLAFKHVMSNVVVELKTSSDASAVDLTGAKVALTHIATDGTVNIGTGMVTPGSTRAAVMVNGEMMMVPQEMVPEAKIIITLTDGTTYSLPLNACKDSENATILQWTGGNKYTYTISLNKEGVQFRVLVQNWIDTAGSGSATLDWD